MGPRIEFSRVIRGVEVEVVADEWDHGPGMPWHPTEVYATREDGTEFELTEDEMGDMIRSAIAIVDDREAACWPD